MTPEAPTKATAPAAHWLNLLASLAEAY